MAYNQLKGKRAKHYLAIYENMCGNLFITDVYDNPSNAKRYAFNEIEKRARNTNNENIKTSSVRIISYNTYTFTTAYCVKEYRNGAPYKCYLIVDTRDNTYKIDAPSYWLNDLGYYSNIYR